MLFVYVGNDIVDLQARDAIDKHQHTAWIKKVYIPDEIDWIKKSYDQNTSLWTLWACKESAYKVIVKMINKRFLNTKKIIVSPIGASQFQVNYESIKLHVETKTNSGFIHCICVPTIEDLTRVSVHIQNNIGMDSNEQSVQIRKAMANKIISSKASKEVVFSKNDLGVPKIELIQKTKNQQHIDISFSHDGQYSAYVYIQS